MAGGTCLEFRVSLKAEGEDSVQLIKIKGQLIYQKPAQQVKDVKLDEKLIF